MVRIINTSQIKYKMQIINEHLNNSYCTLWSICIKSNYSVKLKLYYNFKINNINSENKINKSIM